jgi:hypothetical protein
LLPISPIALRRTQPVKSAKFFRAHKSFGRDEYESNDVQTVMLLWEPPKHSLLYLKSDRSLSKNLHSVIVFKHESHQDSPSAPGKRPAYPSCSSQLQQQTSPGVKKTRGDFTPDS